ncbi:Linearmycin resistance ATP-binding protein LnrL [subsurface metagenome]
MKVIETEGLTKKFGKLIAVDNLDLAVEEGDSFGFLGPNGAGKTTTIRMLTGLLRPTKGTVQILGHDVFRDGEAKKSFGFVPDSYGFYDSLTAFENLQFFAALSRIPKEERKERIFELLEFFGLSGRANSKVGEYSHGMRQRLVIAQALLPHPRLLILDEPTVGLDPRAQFEIRELIKKISQEGITAFISSHLLFEVEDMCNKVGIINLGKLIKVDSIENLKGEIGAKTGIEVRIECEEVTQEIIKAVKEIEDLLDLRVERETIWTRVGSSATTPALITAIVNAGGRIKRVEEHTPSLEDVFLKLTESQGG